MPKIMRYITWTILIIIGLLYFIYQYGMAFFNHDITEKLTALDVLDKKELALGASEMKKHKVIICGITRDDATYFPKIKSYIEFLGNKFADYRVVVFENDSKDCTKKLLAMWKEKNSKVQIVSKDFNNRKRPNIKFLADARNYYINEIANNSEYKDFDIVAIVDMDMAYGFDIRGIENSFAKIDKWDAVCSNGVFAEDRMYDAFAFRSDEFPYTPNEVGQKKYWNEVVGKIQRRYMPNEALVPVHSCFGGLAFYKRDKMHNCVYGSVENDCEHIAFHRCIRNNYGTIMMNPSQMIRYTHYNPYDAILRVFLFRQLDLCNNPEKLF